MESLAQPDMGIVATEFHRRGVANVILLALEARGLTPSDEARERITGCRTLDQLNLWVRRAATAESMDDLFR
jgi:hypothetical protein